MRRTSMSVNRLLVRTTAPVSNCSTNTSVAAHLHTVASTARGVSPSSVELGNVTVETRIQDSGYETKYSKS